MGGATGERLKGSGWQAGSKAWIGKDLWGNRGRKKNTQKDWGCKWSPQGGSEDQVVSPWEICRGLEGIAGNREVHTGLWRWQGGLSPPTPEPEGYFYPSDPPHTQTDYPSNEPTPQSLLPLPLPWLTSQHWWTLIKPALGVAYGIAGVDVCDGRLAVSWWGGLSTWGGTGELKIAQHQGRGGKSTALDLEPTGGLFQP